MSIKKGDILECVEGSQGGLLPGARYSAAGDEYTDGPDTYVEVVGLCGGHFVRRFVHAQHAPNLADNMAPPSASNRKGDPVHRGAVRYFPAALSLVARLSKAGNDKHNPGEEMHHARGKSMDHGDCIVRHQMYAGSIDEDTKFDHAVAVAWRALAQLQELAEKKYGWPLAPGAKEEQSK